MTVLVALLSSNSGFAESSANEKKMKEKQKTQKAPCPSDEFAWGIGLVGLAVIGVVVGLTASMASGSS